MEAAARPAPEPGRAGRLLVPLAIGCAAALAVFRGGGSVDVPLGTALPILLLAFVLGALALVGRLPLPELDRVGRIALAAASALVVWAGLSITWSIAEDESWQRLNRALVLLAFLALGLLGGSLGQGLHRLALALAAVVGAAVGWALLGVVVPSLAEDGDRVARLREPIGYWNALALLADAGIGLGLWLAIERRRSVRAAGAVLVFGSVVVVLLTQSRAGVLAAVAVAALALVRSPRRVETAVLAVAAGAPGLAVAGWAFTRPALVEDGAGRAARVDDARLFAAALVVGVALTVGAALLIPIDDMVARRRRTVTRMLTGFAGALAVGAVVALVASVGNPLSWASDQVSGGECANDPGRIATLCDNNRLAWWDDALEIAADHPLTGTGAGTYAIARLRVRDDATAVTEPHSVPLQLLSDLGLVGLSLGLAAAVAAGVGMRRALLRLDGDAGRSATAVVALPLAWAIHALVDYDLDFVAVSGPALLAVGALLAAGGAARLLRGGLPSVLVLAAAALVLGGSIVLPALARDAVEDTYRAPDLARAADAARRARSLDPLALDAVVAQAFVAELAGNRPRARELLEEATRMQPENPAPWLELGRFHFAADPPEHCAAYEAYNEAYTRDPRSSRWVPGGPLDVSREAVNAGACEAESAS